MNTWLASMAIIAVLLFGATESAAQSYEPAVGVGYAANAPHMLLGAAAWGIIPRFHGFGLYVDVKTAVGSARDYDNFDATLTAEEANERFDHEQFDQEDYRRGFNVGILRPLTDELMVYAGGGYGHRTRYQEFWDPSFQQGTLGYYWVEDPDRSGGYFNVLAGGFFRIGSRIQLQFGAESEPAGFTVGASFNVPAR